MNKGSVEWDEFDAMVAVQVHWAWKYCSSTRPPYQGCDPVSRMGKGMVSRFGGDMACELVYRIECLLTDAGGGEVPPGRVV